MTSARLFARLRQRGFLLPVAVVLLATLVGAACMWTLQGRQTRKPAVPVAVVNADQPVTTGSGKDQHTIAAGRQLAAGLTQPSAGEQTPLAWQLVDAPGATAGLSDGTYYAVLTIPPTFSAAVTSTSGDSPETARLQLVTNDAASPAVAGLAQLAVTQAAATLGDQVTHGFVDTTLSSLTTISTSLGSTTDSAQRLSRSSHQLAESSDDLAEGSVDLADGTDSLADGAAQASAGADRVASGASDLDDAAHDLAEGARRTSSGASATASGAARVARGGQALSTQTRTQANGLDRLGHAAGRTAQAGRRVADRTAEVAAACPAAAGPAYCAAVRRSALATRAESRAVAALATGIVAAGRRSDRIADASAALARATGRVAVGSADVHDGAAQVSRGAGRVDRAAGSLALGAADVATGTQSLAEGTAASARAAEQVASGAGQLADGADELSDGNDSLAGGLERLSTSVPGYSNEERTRLADVVTHPVALEVTAEHQASVEASLVPAVLAAALALACLMMFMTRDPVPTHVAWAQAGLLRRVVRGALPAAGVAIVVACVLLAVLAAVGLPVRSPVGAALFYGLGAVALVATAQSLVALLGPRGRLLALALVAVQAAAVGGLVPIETAPGVFQTLNTVLPLPQLIDGASPLVLGGAIGPTLTAAGVLTGWTVTGLLVTMVAVSRMRPDLPVVPVGRRHPPPGVGPAPQIGTRAADRSGPGLRSASDDEPEG